MKPSTAFDQPVEKLANSRDQLSFRDLVVPLPHSLRRFGKAVRATLYGGPDAPVVVIIGGISANRFPCVTASGSPGWWAGLAGEGRAVDPNEFRILGIDFAADEEGRHAPSSLDQAEVIGAALDAIGAHKAHAIVGASYGGMAALSLAEHYPDRVERLVIVSAAADPHPTSTATREIQRRIVALAMAAGMPDEGLSIARGLAMLTYRSPEEFEQRFAGGIAGEETLTPSEPGAYLRARGKAYRSVMSPGRFLSLSASIDRHRVDPSKITTPCLLIGSASDQLVPPGQMKALASRYAGPVQLSLIQSLYGHDMFLKHAAELSEFVGPFLRSSP